MAGAWGCPRLLGDAAGPRRGLSERSSAVPATASFADGRLGLIASFARCFVRVSSLYGDNVFSLQNTAFCKPGLGSLIHIPEQSHLFLFILEAAPG